MKMLNTLLILCKLYVSYYVLLARFPVSLKISNYFSIVRVTILLLLMTSKCIILSGSVTVSTRPCIKNTSQNISIPLRQCFVSKELLCNRSVTY